MGRIRSKWIKNMAEALVAKNPDKFTIDFENNKKMLEAMKLVDDKPIRNKIAGYIVTVIEKKRI